MGGRVAILLALVLCSSISIAEEPVVIPLSEIWAIQMPGTRDLLSLDLERLPQPFGTLLSGRQDDMQKVAGPGFAVLGTGLEALIAAHEKLSPDQKPRKVFPCGIEISVVFFSQGFGSYVHVSGVERHEKIFKIRYRFVPHRTKNLSSHLALIPVGKLPAGTYHVEIIRSPMEQSLVDAGFQPVSETDARRIVCSSFTFSVVE